MTASRPALVADAEVDWQPYPALDGSFRIKRLVSKEAHGSELAMGVCELAPGQSTVWWSFVAGDSEQDAAMRFGDRAYETYYVLDGRFRFHWQDADGAAESAEGGPGDSFYFAPGFRYRVENAGDTTARFLWTMTPATA